MNGTENTCAGNRRNRRKWPMLWGIWAPHKRCFFALHHASSLHRPCWDGPCRFRFHSDGCRGTVQQERLIVANEMSRCIHLVSQTISNVFGWYVIDNAVCTNTNVNHQRIAKFCGRGLPCSFTTNSTTQASALFQCRWLYLYYEDKVRGSGILHGALQHTPSVITRAPNSFYRWQ